MILIITEQLGLAHAISTSLEHAGLSNEYAPNIEAALSLLETRPADLILLGEITTNLVQAMRQLRQNPITAKLPIILQSDDFGLLNEEYRLRLGASAVINKHQSSKQLLESLHAFLN